ncbi:Hypothetical protein SCLAV_3370 [Streptomyces clavuligerus]|uniref:Uncharacterized protein n=1 Tax=Streptomyces clavuligerus TaxID=1901 RepID=E2Q022_STRCL|nr:Hypothetical protein SCLAV_3370 [Streptomyces clavuligerus]
MRSPGDERASVVREPVVRGPCAGRSGRGGGPVDDGDGMRRRRLRQQGRHRDRRADEARGGVRRRTGQEPGERPRPVHREEARVGHVSADERDRGAGPGRQGAGGPRVHQRRRGPETRSEVHQGPGEVRRSEPAGAGRRREGPAAQAVEGRDRQAHAVRDLYAGERRRRLPRRRRGRVLGGCRLGLDHPGGQAGHPHLWVDHRQPGRGHGPAPGLTTTERDRRQP